MADRAACRLELAPAVVLDVHRLLRLLEACMQLDMATSAAVQLRTHRLLLVPMLVRGLGGWRPQATMADAEAVADVPAPASRRRTAHKHHCRWHGAAACKQAVLGAGCSTLGDNPQCRRQGMRHAARSCWGFACVKRLLAAWLGQCCSIIHVSIVMSLVTLALIGV